MRNVYYKKALVVGIIILFLSVTVTPTIGISNNDDTTPPVTTCSLDPPEPNGENGWYISDVTVMLNATDDVSGVNVTYYRIDGGEWLIYDTSFVISKDGDDILIEFYSVDRVGNVEDVKSSTLDIDQTPPVYSYIMDYYVIDGIWHLFFTILPYNDTSGFERVDFYSNYELMFSDDEEPYEWYYKGPKPHTIWIFAYDMAGNEGYISSSPPPPIFVIGIIRNPKFEEKSVTFYAVMAISNYFGICRLKQLRCPTHYPYEGYIGEHFILAKFLPL